MFRLKGLEREEANGAERESEIVFIAALLLPFPSFLPEHILVVLSLGLARAFSSDRIASYEYCVSYPFSLLPFSSVIRFLPSLPPHVTRFLFIVHFLVFFSLESEYYTFGSHCGQSGFVESPSAFCIRHIFDFLFVDAVHRHEDD